MDEEGWVKDLLDAVGRQVGSGLWGGRFAEARAGSRSAHLAIMQEPYLGLLMAGEKTAESRFSKARQPPWGRVVADDLLILKRSPGPVVGLAIVSGVASFEGWSAVGDAGRIYGDQIRATAEFWASIADRQYATVARIGAVLKLDPIVCGKRDQRGWVVLTGRTP
jgi:hypothetical protein